jgi:hypothetical protein
VIIDATANTFHALLPQAAAATGLGQPPENTSDLLPLVWCYLDAVDGTVKLSGLGSEPNVARLVNDGAWAVGVAFTPLIHRHQSGNVRCSSAAQLRVSDFVVACIMDGSAPLPCYHPQQQPSLDHVVMTVVRPCAAMFPSAVVAVCNRACGGGGGDGGITAAGANHDKEHYAYTTYSLLLARHAAADLNSGSSEAAVRGTPCEQDSDVQFDLMLGPQIVTSTCQTLNQVFAYLDAFQAFDRSSQVRGVVGRATMFVLN